MSSAVPLVRPMRSADAEDVVRMTAALAAFHGDTATASAADLRRHCLGSRRTARIFLACVCGRRVGFAAAQDRINFVRGLRTRNIDLIFVEPPYRSLGVGSALAKALREDARAAGCSKLTVQALSRNERAGKFYLDFGFTRREVPGDDIYAYYLLDLEAGAA